MSRIRFVPAILALFAAGSSLGLTALALEGQQDGGPALGTWAFTGKDNEGVEWKGTLVIEKLDTTHFDAVKYVSLCKLEIEAPSGAQLGVETPSTYDPATRTFTFTTESDNWGGSTYSAVLTADGRSLTKGTWRDTDQDFGEKEKRIVRKGEWSATLVKK